MIPFALTGTGDHWCWWPEREGVVVLCPHDDQTGTVYARTTLTAVYRQALELVSSLEDVASEAAVRAMLERYVIDLGPLLPDGCRETLRWVQSEPVKNWKVGRWEQRGLITPKERDERQARDLALPALDEQFRCAA